MDVRRESEATPTKNRTVVKRKSERELVVTRTVNASAHLVFEAWTKAELFRRWWVPRSYGLTLLSAETPLDDWYRIAKRALWSSLVDVRRTYPHADAVGEFTIFNIGGNKYRLATTINYRTGRIFIRHVMTHDEYSRQDWRKRSRVRFSK